MADKAEIQWEAFRIVLAGRPKTLVHVRPPTSSSPSFHRIMEGKLHSGLEWEVAFLVHGETGTRIPIIEDQFVFIPASAIHASLFLLIDSGAEARGELDLVVDEIPQRSSAGDNAGIPRWVTAIKLEHAWPVVPADLEESVKTIRRLTRDGGGTVDERRAYRSATIRALGLSSESVVKDFRERLSSPLNLSVLPRDMQPLAHASSVLELSDSADKGDLPSFRSTLERIPLAIQLNPDIRALTERVRSLSETPDAADEDRMARIHRAMSQGNFDDAISISLQIPPERTLFPAAQRCRAEALIGQCWVLIDEGRVEEAVEMISDQWISTVLGDGHKGLQTLLEHVNGYSQNSDL